MKWLFLKKRRDDILIKKWASFAAILLSIILCFTAIGKFLHPSFYLKGLDRFISGLELLFIFLIIFFRHRYLMWLFAALVFSLWSGYALFWYCIQLPCGCMGSKLPIPTIFFLCLDGLFLTLSFLFAYLLGGRLTMILGGVIASSLLIFGGYEIAQLLFKHLMFKMQF